MPITRSLEPERFDFKTEIVQRAERFPRVFATPILKVLGYERPDIFTYYPEIDHRIEALLQKELGKAGYQHVTLQSLGKDGNSPTTNFFPYGYELVAGIKDSEWAKKYLSNVQKILQQATRTTDIELHYTLGTSVIFVGLRRKNHMYVPKARSEK